MKTKTKTTKTKTTKMYAVEVKDCFPPRRVGDLYPTRAAAQSAADALPFTLSFCSQVVEINA